jgi:hypothetical protein
VSVARAYNPSYLGSWDQEDHNWGHDQQNLARLHLNQQLSSVAHACYPKLQRCLKLEGLYFHANLRVWMGWHPISMEQSWTWWDMLVILDMVRSINRRIAVQAGQSVCLTMVKTWVQIPLLPQKRVWNNLQ